MRTIKLPTGGRPRTPSNVRIERDPVTEIAIFCLNRRIDHSGVSGTGIVAEGVVFSDRTCALRFLTKNRSTAVYATLEDLMEIHGHAGDTELIWLNEVRLSKT